METIYLKSLSVNYGKEYSSALYRYCLKNSIPLHLSKNGDLYLMKEDFLNLIMKAIYNYKEEKPEAKMNNSEDNSFPFPKRI